MRALASGTRAPLAGETGKNDFIAFSLTDGARTLSSAAGDDQFLVTDFFDFEVRWDSECAFFCQRCVDGYRDGSGTRHARAVRPGPARFRRDEAQSGTTCHTQRSREPGRAPAFLFVRAGARARRGGCRA